MKKKIIIILISIVVLVGLSYVGYEYIYKPTTSIETTEGSELYICPMHPQIQKDHPGVCPICNMELVLKNSGQTMEEDEHNQEEVNLEIGEVMLSPSEQVKYSSPAWIAMVLSLVSTMHSTGLSVKPSKSLSSLPAVLAHLIT